MASKLLSWAWPGNRWFLIQACPKSGRNGSRRNRHRPIFQRCSCRRVNNVEPPLTGTKPSLPTHMNIPGEPMKKLLAACTAVLLSATGAAGQQALPQYESTGTIELAIDGKQATYHSTTNTVPGQPGRLVHTANWRTFPPMMMGGINMAPKGIMLSVTARPTVEPDPSAPHLKITFSLDENDYSLLDATPFEVRS